MRKQTTVSNSINNYQKVKKKACIKHDVQEYLIDTNNNNNLIPLEWWRVNGGKYRNVARVAQKLLAVPYIFTRRKRVFSIFGLVATVGQLNITGV